MSRDLEGLNPSLWNIFTLFLAIGGVIDGFRTMSISLFYVIPPYTRLSVLSPIRSVFFIGVGILQVIFALMLYGLLKTTIIEKPSTKAWRHLYLTGSTLVLLEGVLLMFLGKYVGGMALLVGGLLAILFEPLPQGTHLFGEQEYQNQLIVLLITAAALIVGGLKTHLSLGGFNLGYLAIGIFLILLMRLIVHHFKEDAKDVKPALMILALIFFPIALLYQGGSNIFSGYEALMIFLGGLIVNGTLSFLSGISLIVSGALLLAIVIICIVSAFQRETLQTSSCLRKIDSFIENLLRK